MNTFNKQYASHYDSLYASKDYKGECDLIMSGVDKFGSLITKSLLDVGCGTGGHAIELSKRGLEITGVDLSQEMLTQAKSKALRSGVSDIHWLHGDIRTFNTSKQHDVAIMMFAVIGYLTKNEDLLCGLRNLRQQIKKGGLLMCDFWYGPTVIAIKPSDRIRVLPTASGKVIRSASTVLDEYAHTAAVTFRLWEIASNRVVSESEETHSMRFFYPQELAVILSCAGFQLESLSPFPLLESRPTCSDWNVFAVATAV